MTMTPELRAEVDAAMAKADKHGWAVDEDGDLVLRVPTCWKEGAWQDKAGRDNAAAIVALHNAYPTLTAHIDAQAERIAELEAENARLREGLGAIGAGSWQGITPLVLAGEWQAVFTRAQCIARAALKDTAQ